MSIRLLSLAVIVAGLSIVVAPVELAAQDCGQTCHQCGNFAYEGRNFSQEAPYLMDCSHLVASCLGCSETRLRDRAIDADALATRIRSASFDDLGRVAQEFGDRLLVSGGRDLLVLKGSACDPNALNEVIFISGEAARYLRTRARLLEDHLVVLAKR